MGPIQLFYQLPFFTRASLNGLVQFESKRGLANVFVAIAKGQHCRFSRRAQRNVFEVPFVVPPKWWEAVKDKRIRANSRHPQFATADRAPSSPNGQGSAHRVFVLMAVKTRNFQPKLDVSKNSAFLSFTRRQAEYVIGGFSLETSRDRDVGPSDGYI